MLLASLKIKSEYWMFLTFLLPLLEEYTFEKSNVQREHEMI